MAIILASASPRRQELLRQVGLAFDVHPSRVNESISELMSPQQVVEHLALVKAQDVADRCKEALVIGADTIVVVDGDRLGKPSDRDDAVAMLERLSGRAHQVITGVALLQGNRTILFHETTLVKFRLLQRHQIERYVDSGEPMDKAGAYGIQGRAAAMVESIEGDYFNVVGLPLCRTVQMLAYFGIDLL